MTWRQIRYKITYYGQYFPFTLNSLLCIIAGWWAFHILYTPVPKGETPSPFTPFILLMSKLTILFLVTLAAISVLCSFYCFLYYLYLKGAKGNKLTVDFTTTAQTGKKNKLYINAQIPGIIRPFLGFVKGRLFYDDFNMTDQFSLLADKKKENNFWRIGISGRNQLILPDIKEYNIKGGFIYFQDMLHLFSLGVEQPIKGHFYQPPVLSESTDNEVSPKKTQTLDVRIEQLRRVEGEFLNYKDFEPGDDVRRIVWKVYARNRELVVRTPELYEPYASHLYFYISFYADIKTKWQGEDYLKEMLNYYKNQVWTIYDTLSKKEWEIKYISDQSFAIPESLEEADKTARIISNSNWHQDNSLQQYFSPKYGSALCISSYTNPEELKNTLEKCDSATMIYFVKVSRVFKQFATFGILKQILFQPPPDRLSKLRDKWIFSSLRIDVHKKEKAIEALLNESNVMWGEI